MSDIERLYEIDKGYAVKPRRSPDENAQAAWHQLLCVTKMLVDMVDGGARIKITRSPVFPDADHKDLMRRWVDRILQDAEVVMPTPTGWKCVRGHDLCYGGVSSGPECPYCEPVYG